MTVSSEDFISRNIVKRARVIIGVSHSKITKAVQFRVLNRK